MIFVFDMGGVVTTTANCNGDISENIGISKEKFVDLSKDLFNEMTKGFIGAKDFWNAFYERSGIRVNTDWWHFCFHPEYIEGTLDLIRELKDKGHRVICGTNTVEGHYLNHVERGDYRFFDQVYASNFMGVAKPDVEFWKIIMKAEKCDASEMYFVDDKKENIDAALKLGINAFVFESSGQYRKILCDRGIL